MISSRQNGNCGNLSNIRYICLELNKWMGIFQDRKRVIPLESVVFIEKIKSKIYEIDLSKARGRA